MQNLFSFCGVKEGDNFGAKNCIAQRVRSIFGHSVHLQTEMTDGHTLGRRRRRGKQTDI